LRNTSSIAAGWLSCTVVFTIK